MRTYIGTEVTLDTVFRIPTWNIYCDTTFFIAAEPDGVEPSTYSSNADTGKLLPLDD